MDHYLFLPDEWASSSSRGEEEVVRDCVLLCCVCSMSRSCWPFDVVYLLFVSNNIGEILICMYKEEARETNVALCLQNRIVIEVVAGFFDVVCIIWL